MHERDNIDFEQINIKIVQINVQVPNFRKACSQLRSQKSDFEQF